MKSIFDRTVRQEIVDRIKKVDMNSSSNWGKMNVYQMARHCVIWNEWVLGINTPVYKQEFLGKIFGKLALRSNTKNDKPIGKNMPAGKGFTIKEKTGDVNAQLQAWSKLITDYEHFANGEFVHDFFGKMTRDEIGIFAYKHNDHHLRQFGA